MRPRLNNTYENIALEHLVRPWPANKEHSYAQWMSRPGMKYTRSYLTRMNLRLSPSPLSSRVLLLRRSCSRNARAKLRGVYLTRDSFLARSRLGTSPLTSWWYSAFYSHSAGTARRDRLITGYGAAYKYSSLLPALVTLRSLRESRVATWITQYPRRNFDKSHYPDSYPLTGELNENRSQAR